MRAEMPAQPGKEAAGSRHEPGAVRQTVTAILDPIDPPTDNLMEEVLRRENLLAALKRVQANKGAPGIDGMTVEELPAYLRTAWPEIREQLLNATYVPSPVREVNIPKPGGGTRMLGIPTVLDRLITQAVAQVMSPIFDPGFSAHSYGFRPRRSAHQALEQMCAHITDGHRWVVDFDLEKFFDQVNHDLLVSRGGAEDHGQTALEADPPLSHGWDHEGWIGEYARSGNPSRVSAITTFIEHPVG